MSFLKADTASGRNLKMKKATRLGREMFRGILEVHAEHGRGGLVPASRANPEALALSLPAYEFSDEDAVDAVRLCEEAGLIEVETGGAIRIAGYDEEWMPSCVRCGKPNAEHQFKTCGSCRSRRRGTDPFGDGSERVTNGSEKVRTVHAGKERK